MLDTFIARLKAKAKAAGANLSQKRIDAIADRLHKKHPDVTEETEHDQKIDDVFEAQDFKDFAAADDHQRAKEAKEKKDKEDKEKAEAEKAGSESGKSKEGEGEPEKMPKWFEPFAGVITNLQKEKSEKSMQDKLSANEKLKGIPKQFYKGRPLPTKDDEIEDFVSEIEADYKEFKDHLAGGKEEDGEEETEQVHKPVKSAGGSSKVDPAIKAFADKKAKQKEKEK